MPRARRQIISGQAYEICFRTRRGLPFVCTLYMNLILSSIMARAQRDSKVTICHFVAMANHFHIIIMTKDSYACTRFYAEVKKQLTEALKSLLGLDYLSLWVGNGSSLVRFDNENTLIERIAYIYANPASANLVDSIERYPGLSSWEAFSSSSNTIEATHSSLCPWIRYPTIPTLPCRSLTPRQDDAFTKILKARAKTSHELVLEPNAWMKCFGIEDVAGTNQRIKDRLLEMEKTARANRGQNGWKVKGASRLAAESIDLTYKPKKDSRRIFIYAIDPDRRKQMLADYKLFCLRCTYCYEQWKMGDYSVEWPPGAFQPPIPPRVNWVTD